MNTNRPLQNQLKNLLDTHGVQILGANYVGTSKIEITIQDVVSGQKGLIVLPFGKEV